MGHLVRDGGSDAANGINGGVLAGQQRGLPVQQQAPVLHGSRRKVRDGDQVQLRQRVGNAKEALVNGQDRPRDVKRYIQVLDPAQNLNLASSSTISRGS